jgi:hypothetical protein
VKLEQFATENKLRQPRLDECRDWNISGKRGDIYAFNDELFAVTVLGCQTVRRRNSCREQLKANENRSER